MYEWQFDPASQLVASIDSLGRQVDYLHDGLGRLIEIQGVDPDGAGAATRPVWQTDHDPVGNVLVERDPLGHERTHAYDALYRRTQTTLEDPDAGGPLVAPVIAYTWDAVSNMLSLRDPSSNTTTWQYDDQNRATHEMNELGLTRVTTFDNVGNTTSFTDRNGRVTEWDRDNLYRVTAERWKDSLGNTVHTITSTWDAASQLTSISDAFATYAYTRDDLGRVTEIDNAGTPSVPNVLLAQQWDAASRRTGLSATIDTVADFVNSYSFDTLGRMTRIEQIDGAASSGYIVSDKRVDLAYLADGRFDTITRYEDLTGAALVAQTAFGYDDAGRLIAMDHVKGTTTLAAYDWQLDAASRITSQTSTADGTSTFGYDNNWQIVAADHQSQTDESFSWDANGNPTMSGWVVNTNNRLLSDGTHDYLYDSEGNRTRKTTIATRDYVEYDWDHRNRLVGVDYRTSTATLTKRVELDYDAFDRLIAKRVDENGDGTFDRAERYVHDGSDLILVFDDAGSLTNRLLHGPATDQVFADQDALGEILWNLTDHQNTTRDVVDHDPSADTTSVVNRVEYTAFGEIASQTDATKAPIHSYTGQIWDADVQAFQYNARWYEPSTFRFLSEDPSGLGPDSNPYRYVGNSSPNRVDPTGRWGEPYPYAGPNDHLLLPSPNPTPQELAYQQMLIQAFTRGGGPKPRPLPAPPSRPDQFILMADGSVRAVTSGAHPRTWTPRPEDVTREYLATSGLAHTPLGTHDTTLPRIRPRPGQTVDPTAQALGGAVLEIGASMIPGVGEGMDLTVLLGPNSSWLERGLAFGSLALTAITLGTSPNYGAANRAASHLDEIGDVPVPHYTHVDPGTAPLTSQFDTTPVGGPYIPRDDFGNVIPLPQHTVDGQDIPLPHPGAQGRPHSTIGGRVGNDGTTYRQSATFPGPSWPQADGFDVPWSRVDWHDHSRPWDHPSPHQHIFHYNRTQRRWVDGPPEPFHPFGR